MWNLQEFFSYSRMVLEHFRLLGAFLGARWLQERFQKRFRTDFVEFSIDFLSILGDLAGGSSCVKAHVVTFLERSLFDGYKINEATYIYIQIHIYIYIYTYAYGYMYIYLYAHMRMWSLQEFFSHSRMVLEHFRLLGPSWEQDGPKSASKNDLGTILLGFWMIFDRFLVLLPAFLLAFKRELSVEFGLLLRSRN